MGEEMSIQALPPLMSVIHNHLHALHRGRIEMFRGQLVPCVEVPERVDYVRTELCASAAGVLPCKRPTLLTTPCWRRTTSTP